MKLIFGFFLIFVLFSCSKEKKYNNLITGHAWRIQSLTSNGTELLGSCNDDDFWIFDESGTFEWDLGNELCTASSPGSLYGTWVIDKENITTEINGSSPETGELSLTDEAMVWTFSTSKFIFVK